MTRTRVPLIDRLMAMTSEIDTGCWIYRGGGPREYGTISRGGSGSGHPGAHRVSYEYFISEIPAGLELDHLCRTPRCVNPWHLEPVTTSENVRRAELFPANLNRAKTHCHKGHEFNDRNTYIRTDNRGRTHRQCRECHRIKSALRRLAGVS